MLFCCVLCGVHSTLFAQEVNIEYFSQARGSTVDGESVQILYNPRLSFGNVELVSDSAWRYLNRDEMTAFGNIQITTPSEIIWSDTLYYYNYQDLSQLRGRVVILQDSTTLFGEKVDYNFLTKVAYFREGIRLEDESGILTASRGTYFQSQDSAIFRGEVQLVDSAQYAEGDSLFINRDNKNLRLFSNIFVADSTNNSILTGDYLEADSTGRRFVDGNAYLRNISADTTDTTHINASQLLLLDQDTTSQIYGYNNVRIWNPKFSSVSDTLFYDSQKELFQLISNPIAWHNNIQLTGPFISVQMDSNEVKVLKSYYQTIAVQQDSITGRLHQIQGDTLIADFEEGEISKLTIHPNSHILYHTTNSADEPDGAVEYTSPHTVMYFQDGELLRVVAGQNKGFFLQESSALTNRRLRFFAWNPDRRPERPEVKPEPKLPSVPSERPFSLPSLYLQYINSE